MHILVAVDRSTESQNALVSAFDVVGAFDGTVTAVHVVNGSDRSQSAAGSTDATASDRGKDVLEDAAERAANRDISIETVILEGDPVESIAEYAESHDVDVVYVGHRGLSRGGNDVSAESRGPLGSVAKGLVERTRVPVTVFDRSL